MSEPNKFQFMAGELSVDAPAGDAKKSQFSGIAYHGGMIPNHWAWGNLVFDLEGIELINGKVPTLINHDPNQRAGFVTDHSVGADGLKVSGQLLSNPHGNSVAEDAKEGYPWQMSVHIEPDSIEQFDTGEATVNGQTFKAPITVFRNNVIREAGLVAVGADRHTEAQIFNHKVLNHDPKEPTMDLVEAKAKISELEAQIAENKTQLEASGTELKEFKAKRREQDITQLEGKAGKTFSADEKTTLMGMDQSAFEFMSTQLASAKPAAPGLPEHLFSHQATDGQDTNLNPLDAGFNRFMAKN